MSGGPLLQDVQCAQVIDGRIRALVTAFGAVPGSNGHTQALLGMAAALRADLDLVTLKIPNLPHQSRVGDARMFRVRVVGRPEQQRGTFARAVRRQLEAETYDVVHTRGPDEGLVVAELRRAMGYRFIYEVATFPDESEGREVEQAWREKHMACLEAADLVVVGVEAAARALSERGFGGKVTVVAPGVDVHAYDWWPSAPGDPHRVLYLGSFAPDREIPTLLGAIREAAKQIPIRALIAGEPDHDRREHVRSMAQAFGIDSIVQVRGEPRSVAIPTLVAACDVAVVTASATPRFQEFGDLPEPLLEYMACRRPIIAAGIPAIAELVRDEEEGLLYLPGDEHTLADSIVTLARDAKMAERHVENAYQRVRQRFSGAARRRRMAEVYAMLMPGSQSFDAWAEAFDLDGSGMLPLPSSMIEIPTESQASASGSRDLEALPTRVDASPLLSHESGHSDGQSTTTLPAPNDFSPAGSLTPPSGAEPIAAEDTNA